MFEDRAYILARSESAGGRGINASRVLHSFGSKTLALVTSGGTSGGRFEELLAADGSPFEVVRIANEIRTNLTISDKHGLTLKLNEVGPPISATELAQVEKMVENRLSKAAWFMICGSIPPGVDVHFYARVIELAHRKKVPTLLDTDGDALLHGMEAHPAVVSPNQQEAERLLNRALITRTHFLEAAERIHAMGADAVILSLGARGIVARGVEGLFEVMPPRVDSVCPIGAGDAMAAAFVWATRKGRSFTDALRWGVAAGTASAILPGMTFANLEQTKNVYKNVEVRAVK